MRFASQLLVQVTNHSSCHIGSLQAKLYNVDAVSNKQYLQWNGSALYPSFFSAPKDGRSLMTTTKFAIFIFNPFSLNLHDY